MSAGAFTDSVYGSDKGNFFPCSVQPETLSLTLNGVANTPPIGPVQAGLPSANMTGSRRRNGVNARVVRVRFTGAIPDGYIGAASTITLPVLDLAVYNSYDKNQVGTYTLGGTDYPVKYVGKTPEKIN